MGTVLVKGNSSLGLDLKLDTQSSLLSRNENQDSGLNFQVSGFEFKDTQRVF